MFDIPPSPRYNTPMSNPASSPLLRAATMARRLSAIALWFAALCARILPSARREMEAEVWRYIDQTMTAFAELLERHAAGELEPEPVLRPARHRPSRPKSATPRAPRAASPRASSPAAAPARLPKPRPSSNQIPASRPPTPPDPHNNPDSPPRLITPILLRFSNKTKRIKVFCFFFSKKQRFLHGKSKLTTIAAEAITALSRPSSSGTSSPPLVTVTVTSP